MARASFINWKSPWLWMSFLSGVAFALYVLIEFNWSGYRNLFTTWAALIGAGLGLSGFVVWRQQQALRYKHEAAYELIQATMKLGEAFAAARQPWEYEGEGEQAARQLGLTIEDQRTKYDEHLSTITRAKWAWRSKIARDALADFRAARLYCEIVLNLSLETEEESLRSVLLQFNAAAELYARLLDPKVQIDAANRAIMMRQFEPLTITEVVFADHDGSDELSLRVKTTCEDLLSSLSGYLLN